MGIMDTALPFLLLIVVIFIGFYIVVFFYKAYEDKYSITHYLGSRGATDIAISWKVLDGTRSVYVYDVKYTNQIGRHCQTRCKIGGSYTENEIYWLNPPEV